MIFLPFYFVAVCYFSTYFFLLGNLSAIGEKEQTRDEIETLFNVNLIYCVLMFVEQHFSSSLDDYDDDMFNLFINHHKGTG